jgi:hypothetical protein
MLIDEGGPPQDHDEMGAQQVSARGSALSLATTAVRRAVPTKTSEMTNPAIPTTMRMAPTVDRLIPRTDAVTANFKIAPIAIKPKLEPIPRTPSSVPGHLKATSAANHIGRSKFGTGRGKA